jgi:hypothetical protein
VLVWQVVLSPRMPRDHRGRRGLVSLCRNTYCRRTYCRCVRIATSLSNRGWLSTAPMSFAVSLTALALPSAIRTATRRSERDCAHFETALQSDRASTRFLQWPRRECCGPVPPRWKSKFADRAANPQSVAVRPETRPARLVAAAAGRPSRTGLMGLGARISLGGGKRHPGQSGHEPV